MELPKDKVCTRCKTLKSLADFYNNKNKPSGKADWCKICSTEIVNKWYKDNNVAHKARSVARRKDNKVKLIEYYGNRCFDCGNTFPACVYDFHHLDPKIKERGFGLISTCSWERVCREIIPKCIMLCSNCHRVRHGK